MKRYTRAIALSLLLAIVLTAFGMFSVFAADGDGASSANDYGKIVYDMDAQSTISVNNGTYGPKVERRADGLWEMHYRGYDAATAGTGGDYWLAQAPTTMYVNHKYTSKTVTNDDGSTSTVKEITTEKNTDYFVIDFDISTDTSLLDGIYFHMRFYTNTGGNAQQNYVQLNGTDLESFYLSTHGGGTVVRPVVTPGEWLNVTIVYDFSSVDEEGFAKTADWKIHVYFDGIYAGALPNIHSGATNFYFNRISTDTTAIQNGPDASTLFKNFTYKTFPAGYEGFMTEAGVLGSGGAMLSDIPELAYCLENTPKKDDRLIATVERVGEDEPLELYKYSDLELGLKDGDVVTLERSVSEAIILDTNANVTFKDKNGTVLTPGVLDSNALVYIKTPLRYDLSAGTVLRRTDDNSYRSKAANKHKNSFTHELLASYSLVGVKDSLRKYTYILLDDIVYAPSAKTYTYGDVLDTNLNGHTLTFKNTTRLMDTNSDTKGTFSSVKFRNGTLIYEGNEITVTTAASQYIFEDLTTTFTATMNMFDQRGGLVLYKNVKGTFNQCLTNLKASGNIKGALYVDGSDITVNGKGILSISNTASSQMRQGSLTTFVRVVNSKVSAPTAGGLVDASLYANATGTYGTDAETGEATFTATNAAYIKNDNDIKITVDNSELFTPTASLVSTNIAAFKAIKSKTEVDANEQFSLDADIVISGSKVTAKYVVNQEAGAYSTSLKYADNYTYNTNLTLEDSDFHLSGSAIASRSSKLPSTALNIVIGEEVSLPTNDESKFIVSAGGAPLDNCDLAYTAECTWIKRSLPGAPAYSYTNKLDTHSYIFDGHEYEFIAYLGDPVNEENIPQALPAESSMLKYEWQYNIDGAWEAVVTYKGSVKANLTAGESLALHIYLPADFTNPEVYNKVYIEGYKADVRDAEIDGVPYKAVTVYGIDPTSATKDFTVSFRVADENGAEATVEREVSVLDYIESALKSDTVSAEGKTLVASILNYIEKAARYNNADAELSPALAALLQLDEYKAIALTSPAEGEAKDSVKDLGVFSSVRLALDAEVAWELLVKDGFAGDLTLTYVYAGETVTKTVSVVGGDTVRISLLAYELTSPIAVTYGELSGEINLAGYMSIMPDAAKTEALLALVDAIRIYSASALAYVQ